MTHYYNKSQQDVQFLNFSLVKNSTCFGETYCPSSGVLILYSQQLVFVILLCWLSASEIGMKVCPKHVEIFTKIRLKNNASYWLLL